MDTNTQAIIDELNNRVEDLEQENEDLKKKLDDFSSKLDKLSSVFDKHTHNNLDGSQFIKNYIPRISEVGDIVQVGEGAIMTQEVSNGSDVSQAMVMTVGVPDEVSIKPQVDYNASSVQLFHDKNNKQGVVQLIGAGRPNVVNTGEGFSISSGGSTISSGKFKLIKDSLTGCMINIIESNNTIIQREIASNTESTITIKGTWGQTKSNIQYFVIRPVMLGNGVHRWRSLSIFGIDTGSNRSQLIGITIGETGNAPAIMVGTGAPTYAAPNGSLYLRRDGGATTTLYIRHSGAWLAK